MKKLRIFRTLVFLGAISFFLASCGEDEVSAPSEVSFTASEFTLGESDGSATLGFQLNNPATADLTIQLSSSGTATSGDDYTITETTVVIPKGETHGSFEVVIRKDIIFEGDETIDVSISASGLVAKGTYEITISDDDCDFIWIGNLVGTDVNLDKAGVTYDADVVIAQVGDAFTIDGLNTGFISDWWGETILESVPVTFTMDGAGAITIVEQYIFTTDYNGTEYPYTIYGTGQLNTCDGNLTIDYEMNQDGFLVGAYCNVTGKWMTDKIFKAVLHP